MKQLIGYLRKYLKEELRLSYVAVLAVFLSVSTWYNYKIDFENSVLDSYLNQWLHFPISFLFYAVPYFFAVFAYALCYRKTGFLRQPLFWVASLLAICVISLNEVFYYQNILLQKMVDPNSFYFVRKVGNNIVSEFIFFIPLLLYWRFFDSQQQVYGFSARNINLRPYFLMIVLMLPLITWASFQDDFLRSYPTYRMEYDHSGKPVPHFWIYEIFYGIDFIGVEFFFRGFMVMAIGRFMGAGAIMPMVCVYAYMHFGKPMGETIGSVFGGAILGILAYYSRSIYGGIIIHLGVAYLMEITAFLQTYLRSR